MKMKESQKPQLSINDNEEAKDQDIDEIDETDPDDPRNIYSKTIEEAEDNDGENRFVKEDDKNSVGSTIVTIVKCIVGCGILNVPMCFKTLGFIGATLMIVISILITTSTVYFLMKCKTITQKYGYSMYAKLCFGSVGTFCIKFSIVLMTFGYCCVYLKVFGGIFKSLVELFVVPTDKIYFHPTFYMIIIFFVLMPLMFKEDITSLRKFLFIGVVSIMIFLISMITVFVFKISNGEIKPYSEAMLYPSGDYLQMFVAATAQMSAFTFQMNTFPIYLPLKNRNSSKMIWTTFVSVVIVGIIYMITGTLGFFMYRERLNNVVIEYLTGDIHLYKSNNMFISGVLFLCTIAFYLSALLSMPIHFFSMKKNMITLVGFMRKRLIKKRKSEEDNDEEGEEEDTHEKTLAVSMVNTKIIMESVEGKTKIVLTLIGYVLVLLFTLSVDKIITISNIIGSTVSNIITMLAPTMFIFKLSTASFCSCEKMLSKLIFCFGLVILLTFFYTKIMVFF